MYLTRVVDGRGQTIPVAMTSLSPEDQDELAAWLERGRPLVWIYGTAEPFREPREERGWLAKLLRR